MTTIKRLTIAGFRGILARRDFDLSGPKGTNSLIVYGRNGTGKSSITDAWEWVRTQRIEHLAREGAKEQSFPHSSAKANDSFVEIEFADPSLGTVRVDFDFARVTKPKITGKHADFCRLTPHPCHVRFTDLTRFVYLTKADRYDMLAQLMGFQPIVDYSKGLRRVQKSLEDELASVEREVALRSAALRETTGRESLTERVLVSWAAPLLTKHGHAAAATWEQVRNEIAGMKQSVERDPSAKALSAYAGVYERLVTLVGELEAASGLLKYSEAIEPFLGRAEELKKLLLANLYEQGLRVVEEHNFNHECPLCGQAFDGDLAEHVRHELDELKALREQHAIAIRARKEALEMIRGVMQSADYGSYAVEDEGFAQLTVSMQELSTCQAGIHNTCTVLGQLLALPLEELAESHLSQLRSLAANLSAAVSARSRVAESTLDVVKERMLTLQADESRRVLVEDFQRLARALEENDRLRAIVSRQRALRATVASYGATVDSFATASATSVQQRFDLVSENVTLYFETLEAQTPGIRKPVLKLLSDQDRAVVPEVMFHGQAISPAYRYLSESQLNSFGLAVFLASVRQFNNKFRVIILDDVVNSLDGYKRPQLIEILKKHFADFQVLLFTHDSAWRDRLFRDLASWKRITFARYETGLGPIVMNGESTLEEIERMIVDDKPKQAGQMLGPLLEGELQEVAEAFEVELKYNTRNEYTLVPLLDGVRARAEKKLGKEHLLAKQLAELKAESGFRNLTAHAKNPDIELTREEMNTVVNVWRKVERLVRCQEEKCGRVLEYCDPVFRCGCGASTLERETGTGKLS